MSSKGLILPLVITIIAVISVKAGEDANAPTAPLLQNDENRPVPSGGRMGNLHLRNTNVVINSKKATKNKAGPELVIWRENKDESRTKVTQKPSVDRQTAGGYGSKCGGDTGKQCALGYKCVEITVYCSRSDCPPSWKECDLDCPPNERPRTCGKLCESKCGQEVVCEPNCEATAKRGCGCAGRRYSRHPNGACVPHDQCPFKRHQPVGACATNNPCQKSDMCVELFEKCFETTCPSKIRCLPAEKGAKGVPPTSPLQNDKNKPTLRENVKTAPMPSVGRVRKPSPKKIVIIPKKVTNRKTHRKPSLWRTNKDESLTKIVYPHKLKLKAPPAVTSCANNPCQELGRGYNKCEDTVFNCEMPECPVTATKCFKPKMKKERKKGQKDPFEFPRPR